jgi:drug/metabolite transporter (DMT)-like permease
MGCALIAAFLYALNAPLGKLLLQDVSPVILAGLFYLGAGIGIYMVSLILRLRGRAEKEISLTKSDLPYVFAMIVLDVAAPIALLWGLSLTTAENAALLNNFEIVSTALFAFFLFGEKVSKRLWIAVILVSFSGIMLSLENLNGLSFSNGSLLVLLAACFWGLENNCTRKLAVKNPLQIVTVKGLCCGAGSLLIGFYLGQKLPSIVTMVMSLAVGFFVYGLSIYFYVYAQRHLGAAQTSTYYAVSPFIGVLLALLIFKEAPPPLFFLAAFLMALGTYLAVSEGLSHMKFSAKNKKRS